MYHWYARGKVALKFGTLKFCNNSHRPCEFKLQISISIQEKQNLIRLMERKKIGRHKNLL